MHKGLSISIVEVPRNFAQAISISCMVRRFEAKVSLEVAIVIFPGASSRCIPFIGQEKQRAGATVSEENQKERRHGYCRNQKRISSPRLEMCGRREREKKKSQCPRRLMGGEGCNPIISKDCKTHGKKMGAKNAESGRKAMLNDGPCSRSARREMGSDKHKENISAHSPGQSVCRLDCLGTVDQTAIDFNP